MRLLFAILIASLAFAVCGCEPSETHSPVVAPDTNQLPDTWRISEITAAALDPDETLIESDVLCWQIKEDGRPLRVESCILWLQMTKQHKPKWSVSHLFRNRIGRYRWELAMVDGAPIPHTREFDHPPTSAEILDFIRAVEWSWELNDEGEAFLLDPDTRSIRRVAGFKYLDGRVCLDKWKARTGSEFDLDVPQEYLR